MNKNFIVFYQVVRGGLIVEIGEKSYELDEEFKGSKATLLALFKEKIRDEYPDSYVTGVF